MTAVDTSVVIAAFATWHEGHERALDALTGRPRLPSQVAVETYSVLTRLPPPHRAPPDVVGAFIARRFPEPVLLLSDGALREVLDWAARTAVTGGAIYDAIVAATATEAGEVLVTRDRRALRVYEALGTRYELAL